MNLDMLNHHPWDKVSHSVIALGIFTTGAIFGSPEAGAGAAIGVFYGREQFSWWKYHKDQLFKSWLPWSWGKDGQLDFYIPAGVTLFAYLTYLEYLHVFS